MLERFSISASSYGHSIDQLILLVAVLVGFWFFVAEGVLFWLMFKFRHRDGHASQYVTGEEKHLTRWVTIPHMLVLVCDIVIIVVGINVWYQIKQVLPPADQTVRIIGQQWTWSFQQPGADGILDTADDIRTVGDLHLRVNTTYHFELISRDTLHSFSVPAVRLKQDTVPGRTITGWFRPTRTGTYDIQCTQMCGLGHGLMGARVIVETPQEHSAWIKRESNPSVASAQAPAVPAGDDSKLAEVKQ
jgi:cytochrome c oxidase subunit 2